MSRYQALSIIQCFPIKEAIEINKLNFLLYRALLDSAVHEHMNILKLLTLEDQTLSVRWNPFLVLDLCSHITVHCVFYL